MNIGIDKLTLIDTSKSVDNVIFEVTGVLTFRTPADLKKVLVDFITIALSFCETVGIVVLYSDLSSSNLDDLLINYPDVKNIDYLLPFIVTCPYCTSDNCVSTGNYNMISDTLSFEYYCNICGMKFNK